MGCFDTLTVRCPCGGEIKLQSKAGDCTLSEYDLSDVPVEILGALNGCGGPCPKCKRMLTLRVRSLAEVVQADW